MLTPISLGVDDVGFVKGHSQNYTLGRWFILQKCLLHFVEFVSLYAKS